MKQIVYCLTGRGLYSELSNLALAYCYARLNGYRLVAVSYTHLTLPTKA